MAKNNNAKKNLVVGGHFAAEKRVICTNAVLFGAKSEDVLSDGWDFDKAELKKVFAKVRNNRSVISDYSFKQNEKKKKKSNNNVVEDNADITDDVDIETEEENVIDDENGEQEKVRNITDSNPTRQEYCELDTDNDTLVVKFNVRFLPLTSENLHACSNELFRKIMDVKTKVGEKSFIDNIAYRIATNLVNARAAGRNLSVRQMCRGLMYVRIDELNGMSNTINKTWYFHEDEFGSEKINQLGFDYHCDKISEIAERIGKVVFNENNSCDVVKFRVIYGIRGEINCPVFGGQSFPDDKVNSSKTKLSLIFDKTGTDNQVCISAMKVGNAIRTIDTWYSKYNVDDCNYILPINPYGQCREGMDAFRLGQEDYFSIQKNIAKGKNCSETEMLFFLAVLMRGGLLGMNDV